MPSKIYTTCSKFGYLLCFHFLFLVGYGIETVVTVAYNYSASIECLPNPLALQYARGGIVKNPDFSDGLKGWYDCENAIELRKNETNSFGVGFDRTEPWQSLSQPVSLTGGVHYAFAAWVQIDKGSEVVKAAIRNSQNTTLMLGSVIAKSGCWSMIKGGVTPNESMQANLYFESLNTTIEIWLDNVSLQPFTKEEWRNQQYETTNKMRKRNLRLTVSNKQRKKLEGIKIAIQQTRTQFPIGTAITKHLLRLKAYQDWFVSRFTVTSFENEMKWYATESAQGKENYTIADAMVAFAKQHWVSVRGHNILWANMKFNPRWLRDLSPPNLLNATRRRIESLVSRYKDTIIDWDVVNENMHYSFFEDALGANASAMFYNLVQTLDPNKTLFINEYNTLEIPEDNSVTPPKFVEKLNQIRSFPGNEHMKIGIGLQSHFSKPDIAYMRACLDIFAATKLPVWITELDVSKNPNRPAYLEDIMREAYSHPAVQGIVMWAAWNPEGCWAMCLTDQNFNNLDVGDVVDRLLAEWNTLNLEGVTNKYGVYESLVYHGEYFVTITDPQFGNNITKQVNVTNDSFDTQNIFISM